ncbi:MAG: hypothetical protein ACRDQ4_01775 [Pseudonocardiaceae bacterium]
MQNVHVGDLVEQVITELANKGNTVIVIEHNLDVIKSSDRVIDFALSVPSDQSQGLSSVYKIWSSE